MTTKVTALFRYPVKSLRGTSCDVLELGPRGPLHDREWMVVDDRGHFLTQRTTPRLATLSAQLEGSGVRLLDDTGASVLADATDGPARDVTVWKDTVHAFDCGDAPAAWLSERLQRSCRLVRFPETSLRRLDPRFTPRADANTGFADAYPVLLASADSLDALNAALPRPIGLDRFRANVVVTGATAWAEDEWRVVRVGDVTLDLVKPCARCVVITTDQRTGLQPDGTSPLAALAATRTLEPFGAIFGQNAVHRAAGTLRVGDALAVLSTQPRPEFKPAR